MLLAVKNRSSDWSVFVRYYLNVCNGTLLMSMILILLVHPLNQITYAVMNAAMSRDAVMMSLASTFAIGRNVT